MFNVIDTKSNDTQIQTIYEPKELVKALEDTLSYYKKQTTNALIEASKTREEVIAEIQNAYAEENARLKEKLKFAFGFFSSEKELDAWRAFCKKHEECRCKYKIDGGKMPYIIPYGTGIGQCVTAVCQVCGEKEDITDMDVW